jgi:hypothetical protein
MKRMILLMLALASPGWAIESTTLDPHQDFQKVLSKVGDESPRVLAVQYEAYASKANQLANLLS